MKLVDLIGEFIRIKYPELSNSILLKGFSGWERKLNSKMDPNSPYMNFDYIAIYNYGEKIRYESLYLIPHTSQVKIADHEFIITKDEFITILRDSRISNLLDC